VDVRYIWSIYLSGLKLSDLRTELTYWDSGNFNKSRLIGVIHQWRLEFEGHGWSKSGLGYILYYKFENSVTD